MGTFRSLNKKRVWPTTHWLFLMLATATVTNIPHSRNSLMGSYAPMICWHVAENNRQQSRRPCRCRVELADTMNQNTGMNTHQHTPTGSQPQAQTRLFSHPYSQLSTSNTFRFLMCCSLSFRLCWSARRPRHYFDYREIRWP